MEASDLYKKTAEAQKKGEEDQKNTRLQQDKTKQAQALQPTDEEEDENPFGGISGRDLKKNLGCGG